MHDQSAPAPAAPAKKSSMFWLLLLGAAVVILVIGMLVMNSQRNAAIQRLEDVATGQANPEANAEEAQRVLRQLRAVYDLPEDIEPTVATIVDVEALKKINTFYASAKNGDHLIVTANRAILFDSQAGRVIDVVPVTIQPPKGASSAGSAASTANAPVRAAQ